MDDWSIFWACVQIGIGGGAIVTAAANVKHDRPAAAIIAGAAGSALIVSNGATIFAARLAEALQ